MPYDTSPDSPLWSQPGRLWTALERPAIRPGPTLTAAILGLALAAAAEAQGPPKSLVKRCSRGDFESCYYAGVNQSARNPAESRRFHSLACDGGYRKGCKELHAASEELMEGSQVDQQSAIAHFETACGQNYGRSCTTLASALWKGTAVTTDKARAAKLWQKGCELRSRVGCRRAGSVYEKGEVVTRDLGRALAFYQQSCDQGLESACGDAGRLLQSGVTPHGSGGRAETGTTAAAGPLRKACLDAGVGKERGDACLRLGRMLASGDGVTRDEALAFEAFRTGCGTNHRSSCVEAGRVTQAGLGVEQDDNAAMNFFGKACSLKSVEGCEALCRMQCDAGQPYACERLEKRDWPMFQSCAMPDAAMPG